MSLGTLKVGILGAGGVANALHMPILAQMPNVQIAWLCDQVRERAVSAAKTWGVRQAFDNLSDCPDVNAILVAIPVGRRREALATIFERRWHALVEKPFAITGNEHARIVAEAERAGVEIAVGLIRRFYKSTNIARMALCGEAFGPVREVWAAEASRTGTTGREGSWYQSDPEAAGGGVLIETGSHLIDQLFYILNVEAFDHLCVGFNEVGGIDLEARAVATIKRAGTDSAIPLHLVISKVRDLHPGVVIRCEHASLRFGTGAEAVVEVLDRNDRLLCRLERSGGVTDFNQAVFLEWETFLEQCRSCKPSPISASSTLLSTQFIEAAYAIGSGRVS